ncbi:hypothetical protein [Streptomyces zhihengii]
MSVYASLPGVGDEGDDTGLPWVYQGSHILPAEDDPRGGVLGLAEIPSHITRDGRDDQPADGSPWPWLRIHITPTNDDPALVLDRAQVAHLRDQLTAWLDDTKEPS